ncbi:hypothetical protein FZ934_14480 [Rhizobium grahamii]|uniref:Uncharacterized protein n=1 Tax=Rhizobium grahamii TaxID=1120045 RepID=A0A5Q0C7W2_9HYPH|nr:MULTISPECIES: DUF6428 family protein [Rhizobium]QFY61503.1 hypothetical protein FZ934_14480 [Rhizobium grahamii]QRM49344.1 hypothetical protein F3Y33_08410 [Rhizobium sp. BG6]
MNSIIKTDLADSDITLGDLLSCIARSPDLPLIFTYVGREIKGGYHVTEVKAGQFSALDCGANPEAWSEIFVQLWDIDEDGRSHMPGGKFAAIIRKVSEHVGLDGSAKLTFEVSDGVGPIQLFRASSPARVDNSLIVALAPRPSSCKPRDKWLAEQSPAASCCRPSTAAACCA